jgi:hypothetical protein
MSLSHAALWGIMRADGRTAKAEPMIGIKGVSSNNRVRWIVLPR